MITPFRDVVSAYKFLQPLPAANPIQPINIGLFRGGNDVDPVSQSTGVNDLTQIVDEQTLQVTPVDTPVNDLTQIVDEQTLQVTPVDTPVNDLMQIVNEQTLQVTPVDTPVNNFVDSMSCFKPSCCPMSNDFLLQEIKRLNGIVNKYEKTIHPIPLYTPGRLLFHPDGSEDPEARAFMKNALELAETLFC